MDAPILSEVISRNIHNISWNKVESGVILFWGYFKGRIVVFHRGENLLVVGKHVENSPLVEILKNEISAILN